MSKHPFFGKPIFRKQEKERIEFLLKKYKNEQADEALKEKIWEDLQREKHLGNITIPFKVLLQQDPSKNYPPYIEVVLDTKV